MRRLLVAPLIFTLLSPIQVEAHPISLEERAVDLVIDNERQKSKAIRLVINQFDKQLRERLKGTNVNPAYMAWVKDDCNVTIKAGTHQPRTFSAMEWFDVDVCKGQVKLIDLRKR